MAKNEVVTAITIKTEQSQQTIKGLRKEIADLKKTLDSAVIGSDEFEKASKELSTAQATLKTVLADGNKTIEAVEGSYNHLVATMAELKKQWKATGDEVKRNELGKQIDSINTKLKGLDNTIGNNQRLVGSYAEEFKKALGEQDDATLQTRTKLESVQKVTAGLASGYAAVQGAMTLLNIENENLQQAMVKVQSAMAIAQGIGGLKDLVEGLSRAKVAFQGAAMGATVMSAEATTAATAMNGTAVATGTATVAMNGFKKALIATGIGALVVLLGTVIAYWEDIAKALGFSSKAQEEYNKKLKEQKQLQSDIVSKTGNVITEYRLLQREYTKLSSLSEKQKWIEKNATAFEKLGLNINDVNSANKAFIDDAPNVIAALKAIARAEALRDKYKETYLKAEEEKMNLNYEVPKFINSKANGGLPDAVTKLGLGENDFTYKWGGGQSGYGTYYPKESAIKVFEAEIAKQRAEAEAAIDAEVTIWENKLDEAEKAAAEAAEKTKALVKPSGGSGGRSGGGTGSGETDAEREAKEKAKRQAEVLEEFRVSQLTEEEKKYYELEKKYQEYLKLFEGDVNKQLQVAEWYNDEYTKLVLAELDERIKADTEIAKSAEETRQRIAEADKQRYEEAVAESEKRLSKQLDIYDKSEENQLYLNERRKPQGNGEINAIDNELSKLQGLKKITQEMTNLRVTAIEDEQALFAEYSERWLELENQKIEIRKQTERSLAEISEQYAEQEKNRQRTLAKTITNTFTTALSSASSIISAYQEGINTKTKEGFEKNKKMQIANATIQMLVGITSALAGAFTTKSGPWDIALAAIQAATIATTGGIQIANIKKQQFDGSGGGASANVSVSPSMGLTDIPINYTRNLMGDAETENLNNGMRVYILESDIEESRRKVDIVESNTDF